jgi:hypothetical protein
MTTWIVEALHIDYIPQPDFFENTSYNSVESIMTIIISLINDKNIVKYRFNQGFNCKLATNN